MDGGEKGFFAYFRSHLGAWVTTGISSTPCSAASVTRPSVPFQLIAPCLFGCALLHSTGVLTASAPAAAMFPHCSARVGSEVRYDTSWSQFIPKKPWGTDRPASAAVGATRRAAVASSAAASRIPSRRRTADNLETAGLITGPQHGRMSRDAAGRAP